MKKTAGSAVAVAALVLALFWVQRPWEWKRLLGGVRKEDFVCKAGSYTTEIISIDPLLIYINDFVDEGDIRGLIAEGCVLPSILSFPSSPFQCFLLKIVDSNSEQSPQPRETRSLPPRLETPLRRTHLLLRRPFAFLPSRAMYPPLRSILHKLLFPPSGDFGTPQLVHYEKGEKFDVHHDWYEEPQPLRGKHGRWFNRVASFFVYLEGECSGGKTWFPYIDVKGQGEGKWRKLEEDGGTAFAPKGGNALF
jgi:prolyl 4-hydroxylase